jgi:MerR family copper efflux transcriptional regulator
MNISDAGIASDLNPKTIRYYEAVGLVQPTRLANGYRDFGPEQIRELVFVRRARHFGFTLDECRQLLSLYRDPGRESQEVHHLVGHKLEEMSRHIEELVQMKHILEQMVSACPNDEGSECAIIDSLSETGSASGIEAESLVGKMDARAASDPVGGVS